MSFFQPIIDSLAGRRLIVHAGTPKTGTTALQRWLFDNRKWLQEQKLLYPSNVSSLSIPKHQWLIDSHQSIDNSLLKIASRNIADELLKLDDNIESVLLSTEGISNHFFDLVLPNKENWVELTKACPTTIIITFRNPLQYALSRYCQNLINPPSKNPFHSTSLKLEYLCKYSTWLQALNYQQIIDFWESLVGNESLICLAYSKNIVDSFCRFGLGLTNAPHTHEVELANVSIGELGAQLIRQVNELSFDHSERENIIQHIRRAEAELPMQKNRIQHSQLTRDLILTYCNQHLDRLVVHRPELTPALTEIAGEPTDQSFDPIGNVQHNAYKSTAFICCIQPGFLEEQVIRLAQSIRLFSGSYSQCKIYAVSPLGEELSKSTLQRLEALDVTIITKNLNKQLPSFPYANKAYAVEYVQSHHQHESLIFLDSDTMFLNSPHALYLDDSVDYLARPVDLRNICCSPLDDLHREYWEGCCQLAGIQIDDLPVIMSSVDNKVIHANWNGGLLMFRGDQEVGSRWRFLIERMWGNQLMAKPQNFWGSGQVSFTIAVTSLNMRGKSLGSAYNIPLHLSGQEVNLKRIDHPIHIHYHWLLDPDNYEQGKKILGQLNIAKKAKKFIDSLPQFHNLTKKTITGF